MKRLLIAVLSVLMILGLKIIPVSAQSPATNIYLFYGEGCPHCEKEKAFLAKILPSYPTLKLHEFEIYYNQKNNALLQKVSEKLGAESGGVPFLIVGDTSFVGFAPGFNDQAISNRIKTCAEQGCSDSISAIVNESIFSPAQESTTPTVTTIPPATSEMPTEDTNEKVIHVPLIGQVNVATISLPVLTIILGTLDGFNPCAMWTLLFLISLLLGMKNRKRMWILGTAFIVTSAGVYFLFLSAWLNLFLFLGLMVWVRAIIGVVSIAAAGYYLYDYSQNKKGGCKVMGNQKRQRVFAQLRTITQKQQFLFALGGIILLAIAVNMVELICSAGLPAVYTQVLALSQLPTWQYYMYLLMYILFFMLDDLIIFFTAMITLRAVGVQSKYSRYSHLIGGILMLIIGLLLLFKPEWLMFG